MAMAVTAFALFISLLVFCGVQVEGGISNGCLQCIRQIEGGTVGVCRWDVNSDSCGPFQIKLNYWKDCRAGSSWQTCAKQLACSETCVRNYMNRYGPVCVKGRTPTCEDYARIHNGGPGGCKSASTVGYWAKVKKCCDRAGNC